jgi:PTH1 family peptidyl-tRNA hydrolase
MAEEKVEEQSVRLIIGLGKPGIKYAKNKKNVAFIVIDYAIEKLKKIHPYEMVSGWIMRPKYMLMTTNLKPLTMVVKPRTTEAKYDDTASNLIAFYKTIPENLYFIYPDISLALGQFDVSKDLGSAPEPIRKMEKKLETRDFWKVRIGIAGANEELTEVELAKFKFIGEKLVYELEIANITT